MSVVVDQSVRNNLDVFGSLDLHAGMLKNPSSIGTTGNTISIITPTTAVDQGNSEVKVQVAAADRLVLNANNSALQVGSSKLNLAYLSDGTSAANTTYLSAANAGNTADVAVSVLPNQMRVYQNLGVIQRMVVDDIESRLQTKTYGVSGSQLQLTDAGFMTLRNGTGSVKIEISTASTEVKTRAGVITPVECRMNNGGIAFDVFTTIGPFAGQLQNRLLFTSVDTRFRNNQNSPVLHMSNDGVMIGNNNYTLPFNQIPTAGQYIEATGVILGNLSVQSVWKSPPPKVSSYGQVVVSGAVVGVARTTLCSASIRGSLTIPASSFELGSVWKLSAYGTYNVVPAQTVVLSILMGGIAVAFTPALSIADSPASWSSSWVLTVRAIGAAGVARLVSGSTNSLDTTVVCSTTTDSANFNTTIANVLDFTSTFSVANADTITCESVSFYRIV